MVDVALSHISASRVDVEMYVCALSRVGGDLRSFRPKMG